MALALAFPFGSAREEPRALLAVRDEPLALLAARDEAATLLVLRDGADALVVPREEDAAPEAPCARPLEDEVAPARGSAGLLRVEPDVVVFFRFAAGKVSTSPSDDGAERFPCFLAMCGYWEDRKGGSSGGRGR